MSAAGGAATSAVAVVGAAMAGAMDEGSPGFISMVAGAVAAAGAAAAGVNFISIALISVASGVMSVPGIGGASVTRAFAVGAADAVAEDAFAGEAFAVEVEAAESDAEAGVEAGEGTPRRSAAKADDPNNAKNIAATATLISLPRRERKRARAIEYRLNVDFYWQFLPRKPLVKIGPATELRELRALPESELKRPPKRAKRETRFGGGGVAVAKVDVCHSRCWLSRDGWRRTDCGLSQHSLLFECGEIADVAAQLLRFEQTADDLAAARFGQLIGKSNFCGHGNCSKHVPHMFL